MGDGSPQGGLTISVNTNWFNGFNLERIHNFLLSELAAVRDALDHLQTSMSGERGRDENETIGLGGRGRVTARGGGGEEGVIKGREWEWQCELIMRANSALNVTDFARIVMARAQQVLGSAPDKPPAYPDPPGTLKTFKPSWIENGQQESPPTPELAAGHGRNVGSNFNHGTFGGYSDSYGKNRAGWQEEQKKVLALSQIKVVLRNILVVPCIDHIFFERESKAGDDESKSREMSEDNAGSLRKHDGCGRLRETLASVEAYLRASTVALLADCRANVP